MKEHPILFSGEMVRAILAGRKTQTRRVVKPWTARMLDALSEGSSDLSAIKPPYAVGDRLWVRETWQEFRDNELPPGRSRGPSGRMGIPAHPEIKFFVFYRADGEVADHPQYGAALWRPSIHMPRWASRITLEATGIRVEQLQDISEKDAVAVDIARRHVIIKRTLREAGYDVQDRALLYELESNDDK